MIAALDAHYDEDTSTAVGAAVVFGHWEDAVPTAEYTAVCGNIEAYVPGEFFKRELPCLLAVLKHIAEPLDAIVIDGYVMLGDRPGLGMRLWDALGKRTPIVGVAKTHFLAAQSVEVIRGTSKQPLFVTTTDAHQVQAASHVSTMAGAHRIPTLLKRVDQLARDRLRATLSQAKTEALQ